MIIQGQQIKIPVQHGKYIFRINSHQRSLYLRYHYICEDIFN